MFVDLLSQIVVNESSDMSMTSSDDELREQQNVVDMQWAVNRMQRTGAVTDKTLLDVFRIQRARERRLPVLDSHA